MCAFAAPPCSDRASAEILPVSGRSSQGPLSVFLPHERYLGSEGAKMQHLNSNRPSISVIAVVVPVLGAALLGTIPVQAQTLIIPGESIVLDTEDGAACEEQDSGPPVQKLCRFKSGDMALVRNLNVTVVSGVTPEGEELLEPQTGAATTTMTNQVLIPNSPTGIQILPVQIATEVSWTGYLIVGGFNNTFAQVSATLQIRNTTTNQVVASDTFLFERADASLTLDAVEAISGAKLSNGTGTDITALLGYPFNRTRPGPQFSRDASQEGAPGSVGARALAAAWTALPGAAWWR